MAEIASLEVFSGHDFLHGLSEQHRLRLVSAVTPFSIAAGEVLGREGTTADKFYLIQSGKVAIETSKADAQAPLQVLGPGEVVGWSWLVAPHQWKFTCHAVTEVHGLQFDGFWLRDQCEQDPYLGYVVTKKVLEAVAQRLGALRIGQSSAASEGA